MPTIASPTHLETFTAERLEQLPAVADERLTIRLGSTHFREPGTMYGEIHLPTTHLSTLWHAAALMRVTYSANRKSLEHLAEREEYLPFSRFDYRIGDLANNFEVSIAGSRGRPPETEIVAVSIAKDELDEINTIYIASCAWVIYHESAHYIFGHNEIDFDGERDIFSEEMTADAFATENLEAIMNDAARFTSRFGQLAGAASIMFIDERAEDLSLQGRYPHPDERLDQILELLTLDPNAEEYLVANSILRLRAMHVGLQVDGPVEFGSLRQAYSSHRDLFRTARAAEG